MEAFNLTHKQMNIKSNALTGVKKINPLVSRGLLCDLFGLGTVMQTAHAHALHTSRACAADVVSVSTVVQELLKYVDILRQSLNFSEPQVK